MAFFRAIGKYIEDSGEAYILGEAGVIAEGSLNGYINGTHFNRCKRLHTLFATALESLYFAKFCRTRNIPENIQNELKQMCIQGTALEIRSISGELKSLVDEYHVFSQETGDGAHGKTAQYWYGYINLIKMYLRLSRRIHTGDHSLFVHCIWKMAGIFFTFNQPNYSRWLLRLHDNMLKMEEMHPGISQHFKNGALSIRRTKKDFSRPAVDLTLEQTINADAASRLTGITAFTNSVSARQRWAKTHFMRTEIITKLYEEIGLQKKEDVTSDLRTSNRKRHQIQFHNVVEKIK